MLHVTNRGGGCEVVVSLVHVPSSSLMSLDGMLATASVNKSYHLLSGAGQMRARMPGC